MIARFNHQLSQDGVGDGIDESSSSDIADDNDQIWSKWWNWRSVTDLMSSGLVVTGFSIAARQKIWIGIKVYVQDKLIKYILSSPFVAILNMIDILCIFETGSVL